MARHGDGSNRQIQHFNAARYGSIGNMTVQGGFWSYRRDDDSADNGRIAQLARDIVSEYELLTGESIELFLDRDSLEWGNAWLEKVDGNLANVAFFVPVLTPRYFQSKECRRELRTFANRAEELGVKELVLPLKYVDFPALHEEEPEDDLIALVKRFQWAIWSDLRFSARESPEYRKAVSELAQRLVNANIEAAKVAASAPVLPEMEDDDSAGLIDLLAEGEEAMPQWTETIDKMAQLVGDLGDTMQTGAVDIERADASGKGFAGRLTIARRIAGEVAESSEEMLRLGNDFATQLSAIDGAMRAILAIAGDREADDEERAQVADFVKALREMSETIDGAMGQLDIMLANMEPVERMSRDLRRPLKQFRQGLTVMGEARDLSHEWVALADEAGF